MAADYIVITKTNRPQMGTQAIRLANLVREMRDLTDALLDAASRQWDTGPVYTKLKDMFGITNDVDAGAFLAMITNLHDILNTNATVAGATRLANMDEFVSRLAGQ